MNTQQKPVFGVSLEDHLQTSGRQISYVIAKCVDLLKNSVTEEGIFRVSGSLAKVKLLRNAFNSGHLEMVDFTSDTHAVASTLKSYLRELPEPLLTFDLYGKWVEAVAYVFPLGCAPSAFIPSAKTKRIFCLPLHAPVNVINRRGCSRYGPSAGNCPRPTTIISVI